VCLPSLALAFYLLCRCGIKAVILFPKIADHLKSNYAEEAYNPDGLVPRAIQMIKSKFPEVVVCTDVALDPYSNQVRCVAVLTNRSNRAVWCLLCIPCSLRGRGQ
jgi:delta-aminolevulinic acid dehydratase/porphobilinogen synthase